MELARHFVRKTVDAPDYELYKIVAAINVMADKTSEWRHMQSMDEFMQWACDDASGHLVKIIAFRMHLDALLHKWMEVSSNIPPDTDAWEPILHKADTILRQHNVDDVLALATVFAQYLSQNDPFFQPFADDIKKPLHTKLTSIVFNE